MDRNEVSVDAAERSLGPAERKQYAGMRFPKRRRDWLLGRCAAKALVRAVLDPDPQALLEIRPAPGGAPLVWIDDTPRNDLCLSISHSGSRAFCALAALPGVRIGADLEQVEARSEAFVQDYFTPAELAWFRSLEDRHRPLGASLLWSAKESMLKALQVGLRMDTRRVEVREVTGIGEVGGGWKRMSVAAGDLAWQAWWRTSGDYVQTLAICAGRKDRGEEILLEEIS